MKEKPTLPSGVLIGGIMFLVGILYTWSCSQSYKGGSTFLAVILLFGGAIIGGIALMIYISEYSEYEEAKNSPELYKQKQIEKAKREQERAVQKAQELQAEKEAAELSQSNTAPWEKKYYTYPCPYCGHYKVRYANWDDKKMSVAINGYRHSTKVHKKYICDNCKHMWV